jgi:hypothetical protein
MTDMLISNNDEEFEIEKAKNETVQTVKRTRSRVEKVERNVFADLLSQFLMIAIIYGVPVLLFLFGLYYIYGLITVDLDAGVRSLAAGLLPLVITLAFYKSQIRQTAVEFLSKQRLVAFGFSFAMAMAAASIVKFLGSSSGVPIGELAFSATLALMVFGNSNSEEVSYLHVGTVTGFLTYIVIFGLGV